LVNRQHTTAQRAPEDALYKFEYLTAAAAADGGGCGGGDAEMEMQRCRCTGTASRWQQQLQGPEVATFHSNLVQLAPASWAWPNLLANAGSPHPNPSPKLIWHACVSTLWPRQQQHPGSNSNITAATPTQMIIMYAFRGLTSLGGKWFDCQAPNDHVSRVFKQCLLREYISYTTWLHRLPSKNRIN